MKELFQKLYEIDCQKRQLEKQSSEITKSIYKDLNNFFWFNIELDHTRYSDRQESSILIKFFLPTRVLTPNDESCDFLCIHIESKNKFKNIAKFCIYHDITDKSFYEFSNSLEHLFFYNKKDCDCIGDFIFESLNNFKSKLPLDNQQYLLYKNEDDYISFIKKDSPFFSIPQNELNACFIKMEQTYKELLNSPNFDLHFLSGENHERITKYISQFNKLSMHKKLQEQLPISMQENKKVKL